jgi:hypothetical protein
LEYVLREQVNRYRDPRSGGKLCSIFAGIRAGGYVGSATNPRAVERPGVCG